MRDQILEMRSHTKKMQAAIDAGKYDEAWHLIQKYQEWCYERISVENHNLEYAGTLLSSAETFRIRILKKEKRYKQMLIHVIYQAAIDARPLKSYEKNIKSCFRRCKFKQTSEATAVLLFRKIQARPFGGANDYL